jgi:hypothetical protein
MKVAFSFQTDYYSYVSQLCHYFFKPDRKLYVFKPDAWTEKSLRESRSQHDESFSPKHNL